MIIGHTVEGSKPVRLDLNRILDGRMLLQANSGGGKSYAVRRLCEVTHHKVQQIILDPEGEFASLRERFDYILVGGDGDIPINVRSSELLARRILELGTSAIITRPSRSMAHLRAPNPAVPGERNNCHS